MWRMSGIIIVLLAVSVVVPSAAAGVSVTTENTRWEKAVTVNLEKEPAVIFGVLGGTGDARFYRLTLTEPERLTVNIDAPIWADPKFHPQLVVYQPDPQTFGPILPMPQPPNTIALVYPSAAKPAHFERLTQISVVKHLQADVELPLAGTYYLAVYNSDREPGRFRLTVSTAESSAQLSAMTWPKHWWLAQTWASERSGGPVLIVSTIVLVIGVVIYVFHARRLPLKKKKS